MITCAEFECMIHGAGSLKEKRAVLQRIMTRLKQKYNVSVAEVGHQDAWQRTSLAIVSVASTKAASQKEVDRALAFVDSFPEWERLHTTIESL
ncbi:DUF503 domain-containing protein [Rossellomorea marisflavi]|uniref:Uncharacterized protein n=1 Tax=Rossellomorea marisflavi TaxID=189381 RepID=A0A0J5TH61_9BACI|nr:DUF503 family protein [Rossellomorea marisflavi]KMK96476.1 hypothetical protein VL03_02440 [Rossellomorea marisflavi]KML06483.1 hypothetical protein VL06_10340 [Rossellomorea marisflavi]KML32870.1 hypothetical protein VL12_13795 [Rossellomorea marisflavi]KZE49853.1 hypothetical protein AV649_02145 [Rossellomorea marisflavi]MCM2604573.1 DUF503 family protein [Rossellomorea marisflavi]